MSSVVTMGYQPEGSMALITSFGYGLFAHITPPTPPTPDVVTPTYGPALSPAERRRWFGDFESPISRAARRKTEEYLRRIEFGILPAEVKTEIVEKAIALAPQKAEAYIVEKSTLKNRAIKPERILNAVLREIKSEIRQEMEKRRIIMDEQSEEEDIVVISTYLM